MKLATTLTLVLTPLLVVADGWHFETSSGRADGTGSRSCQRFYMKKSENFTFKMDKSIGRSKRSAAPAPQGCSQKDYNERRCGNGDWGSYNNQPQNGGNNNGGWNGPTNNPQQNKPSKPPQNNNGNRGQNGNGGEWRGPTQAPPPPLKCCLKMYLDDDCKDKENEMCLEDKSEKREGKGKATKDFKSFNIACQ